MSHVSCRVSRVISHFPAPWGAGGAHVRSEGGGFMRSFLLPLFDLWALTFLSFVTSPSGRLQEEKPGV
jgi:hypothetical protein